MRGVLHMVWLSLTLCAQVESLQSVVRDRRANWKQSMAALKLAKQSGARVTKTSIMLGCGEQPHEVLHAFRTLRENGTIASPQALYKLCSHSQKCVDQTVLLLRLAKVYVCKQNWICARSMSVHVYRGASDL